MKLKTIDNMHEFEKKYTPHGTAVEPVYIMEYDKNGHKYLQQNGYTNTQDLIQANLESTKIENIIRRCTDPGTLMAKIEQFIDTTNMPKNLYEVQNKVLRMKEEFFKLPKDIKAKFNNSADEYAMSYGTVEWANALGIKTQPVTTEEMPKETKKEE